MNYLIVVLLVWWILYTFLYSPKARIRRLFREIYNIPIKLARVKRNFPKLSDDITKKCRASLMRRYKMIDALLEYNFDPEADKEYIEKTREKLAFWEADTEKACHY